MSSLDEAGDRVAILQMNADLRHAQLEMLSAQCATDRVRLRYSAQDIVRYAQRDTLRKALSSASALHDYYNSIARQLPDQDSIEKPGAPVWGESKVSDAIARVAQYLSEQRQYFRPNGIPLDRDQRHTVSPFFSATLLNGIRTVSLEDERVPNPGFYIEAKAMGFKNLPDLTHMASLTFEDVLVFHGPIATRTLFHALVHAVQFEVLGLDRYAELFVRGFLRTHAHISVPLEAHAFLLESEFAGNPAQCFKVEERVRLWTNQGRY